LFLVGQAIERPGPLSRLCLSTERLRPSGNVVAFHFIFGPVTATTVRYRRGIPKGIKFEPAATQ
jgi:hypothetical protein